MLRILPLFAVAACLLSAASWAADPMITRHANLGATIIVSNVDRYEFEDFVAALKPRFLEWVDVSTPKQQVPAMPEPVVFIIFLIRADSEGVDLHESWHEDYPANLSGIARWNIELAARHLPAPDQKPPRESLLIKAPTEPLLWAAVAEAFRFGRFPENRPITHNVIDLRPYPSVACMPSVAGPEAEAVGNAAEVGLYRGLLDLRAFRVVGRDNPIITDGASFSTQEQLQRLGRQLAVQAVTFAEIGEAKTQCKETIEYKTTGRRGISPERQAEFDRWAAQERAAGREVDKDRPDADMVWAAQYRERLYTTTLSGRVLFVDTNTGDIVFVFEVSGSTEAEEADEPRDRDYRWYRIEDTRSSSRLRTREYWDDLRVVDAAQLASAKLTEFASRLAARAILPVPGREPDRPSQTDPTGPTAKILSVDGSSVFLNLGSDAGVQEKDSFSLFADKQLRDPDTGEVVETIQTRIARLEVVEVFTRVCRCELVQATEGVKLEPGMLVNRD